MNINITTPPASPTFSLRGFFTLGSVSSVHQYIDWNYTLNSQRNLFPSLFSLRGVWKIETFLVLIQGEIAPALRCFNQFALKTSGNKSVRLMRIYREIK